MLYQRFNPLWSSGSAFETSSRSKVVNEWTIRHYWHYDFGFLGILSRKLKPLLELHGKLNQSNLDSRFYSSAFAWTVWKKAATLSLKKCWIIHWYDACWQKHIAWPELWPLEAKMKSCVVKEEAVKMADNGCSSLICECTCFHVPAWWPVPLVKGYCAAFILSWLAWSLSALGDARRPPRLAPFCSSS